MIAGEAEEAQDEAQTGTKRTAEEAQGEAQTSTKLTHEEAQREAQTSTKRVETVDAEWYTVRTLAVPEGDATRMATEDDEENDPRDKHIVTGHADQPPTLEAHVLRDYDDQAEVEEIERLIQMGVLVEPVRGATFATIWKGDKGTWWRRARLVARQYRWATDMEAEDTFSPDSAAVLHLNVDLEERKAAQVHVDDAMLAGDEETVNPLLANLRGKYTIKVNGPFFPGDEFEFLKRRFRIEADGSITVRAAAHFYLDIYSLLGEPRLRNTPGPVGDLFMVDDSPALGPTDGTLFRTVVGKLLYIAAERPDVQVVIQFLASKAAAPTEGALRVLKHLAGFMKATEGHGVNLKAAKGASIMNFAAHDTYSQHLVEAVSDSNFGTDRATRKSLVALTQTVGESILIHKVWEFLTRASADHVARSNSSVARAIASRLGVGRVKHLQTSGPREGIASGSQRLCAVAGMVDDSGSKGVNAKTLHLVQLLLAGTLQGCAYESYEDTSVFLELVGTVYEEHPRYFVFFLTALALLVTAFLGYLNGVQWRMSIQIGRGPTSGLEPGYGMSGPARSNERNVKTDNSQNEHHEPDTADPDTENSQDEHTAGRTGTPARSRHAARPRSGRPDEPVDVATNLKRIVRYAPNWGYGYPVATYQTLADLNQIYFEHKPRRKRR
ncbi:true [Symbiodinium microadriaticum]|nr:true [Symbiodinium microadriaticum]CAE7848528.1 true [Symbiodinium sp. KB8]